MTADFYRQFEDRFRGSRDVILERLTAYEPFVAALTHESFSRTALDLGCGRGEWLEFVAAHGFSARGVDVDQGMLAACAERGLPAEQLDALEALRAQPSESLTMVSAVHFIEHVPFDYVLEAVGEALRVLEPGGLLILESPNPENLLVGSELFYLDPSHQRPLPRALVAFVAEYAGFSRACELGLHGAGQVDGHLLANVLRSVSLDYAVVAQKGGPADLVATMDALFAAAFEAPLADLVASSDRAVIEREARVTRLDHLAEQANLRMERLEHGALQTSALVEQTSIELDDLRLKSAAAEDRATAAENRATVAETRATHVEAALDDMWRSRSWRLTRPLRATAGLLRRSSRRSEIAPTPEPAPAPLETVPLTPRGQQIFDTLSDDLRDASDR